MEDDVNFVRVHGEKIRDIWPQVDEFIISAYQRDDQVVAIDQVYKDLLENKSQLWGFFDETLKAVVVGRVRAGQRFRGYELYIVAGEGKEHWTQWILPIEEYARQQSCQELYITGRQGWARVFKDLGYTVKYVTLSKDLEDA